MSRQKDIEVFRNTISKVRNKISSSSVYTPWISFKVGNTLHVNTSSQSLYGNNSNYFLSMENVKNGSQAANSFSISLAYVPSPGSDPNFIDKALSYSDKSCTLQYGYGDISNGLFTREYSGKILDYTTEIRNGMLYYIITGYSGIVPLIENRLSFPSIEAKTNSNNDGGTNTSSTDKKTTSTTAESTRPSVVAKNALEKYFKLYGVKYNVYTESNVKDLPEDKIYSVSDITLFDYVNNILSIARDETQPDPDKISITDKIRYTFLVSDDKSDPNITIVKIDPNETKSSSIIFNWMDKNDNLVIDFRANFKGAVLLHRNYLEVESKSKKYTLDSKGEEVEVHSIQEFPTSSEVSDQDVSSEYTTWSEAIQHSYTATLILQGIPCEIPIATSIEIVPLIYGQKHHTAGNYIVTKTTDVIDSGGFRTSLDLVRVDAEEITNYRANTALWRAGGSARRQSNVDARDQ